MGPAAADSSVPSYAKAVVILPAALFAWFCALIPSVSRGESVAWSVAWLPERGIHLAFFVDGLGLLFALLITGIGSFILLYASEYMRGHPQVGRFTAFLAAFMLSMLGLVLSDNLIALFVFWELTTITSFLLIGYFHEDAAARRAALQGLLVTGAGALAMLAGFVLLGSAAGTYSLSEMLAGPAGLADHPAYLPIAVLVLAGAFTKSAQFPFHFWLPNAMAAPTPVSAYLHSATMVKAGVYLLARLSPVLGGTEFWTLALTAVGGFTAVYSAAVALTKKDLKQVLAYTTVMALGVCVMFLGLDVESDGLRVGVVAAVAFLLVHALYKAALFMVAGAIDHATGTRDLSKLGGLRASMPLSCAAAALAALSMAGVPPFFGFVGKEALYAAALEPPGALLAPAAILAANLLVAAAALLVSLGPFTGQVRPMPRQPHEGGWPIWSGPLVLGCVGLAAGLFPGPVFERLVLPAVESVTGEAQHYHAALWHGFNLPLALSALTLAAGAALYWARGPVLGALRGLIRSLPVTGDRAYDACMAGVASGSQELTRLLQCGVQRRYLLIVFATIGAALGGTMWAKGSFALPMRAPAVSFFDWALAGLIVASAFVTIVAQSRLLAICALGVVGAATALVFLRFGAPDVAMAQFTVETLIVVIVAMVLLKLPGFRGEVRPSPLGRIRDGLIATVVGVATTLVLLAVTLEPPQMWLRDYFEANSVPGGHGRNVVNVILVDFRALDTLGEITVLAIASVAAYTLVARLPRRRVRLKRAGRRKAAG